MDTRAGLVVGLTKLAKENKTSDRAKYSIERKADSDREEGLVSLGDLRRPKDMTPKIRFQ